MCNCKWEKIDSAPKDGTIIDIFTDGDRYADCHYSQGNWYCAYSEADSSWLLGDDQEMKNSYWKPIQTPPKQEGE